MPVDPDPNSEFGSGSTDPVGLLNLQVDRGMNLTFKGLFTPQVHRGIYSIVSLIYVYFV